MLLGKQLSPNHQSITLWASRPVCLREHLNSDEDCDDDHDPADDHHDGDDDDGEDSDDVGDNVSVLQPASSHL